MRSFDELTQDDQSISINAKYIQDRDVNISNALNRACHGLTLAEKRVISHCIGKLDSASHESGRHKFVVHASEYAAYFDIDINTAYDQLQHVGDHLLDRKFTINTVKPDGKKIEEKFVWVSGVKYYNGEGKIELGFSPEMSPYLFGLGKNNPYTSYKLRRTAKLQSIYSWRLFEILIQFKSIGLVRIDTEGLCNLLEAPEICLRDFGQLRRIIERAITELGEKSNLKIKWAPQKKGGRKITGLEFKFKASPRSTNMSLEFTRPMTE